MKWLRILIAGCCAAALLDPPEGNGCGPFLPEAQFVYIDNPGPEFLTGQLGIVRPEYYRKNLVVAYRYLSGAPLSAEEIQALAPVQRVAVMASPAKAQPYGPYGWLQARNAVPGVQRITNIDVYRDSMVDGSYEAYQNCLDSAFDAARETLAARSKTWGEKSAELAEWLRGQDAVFANCGSSGRAPEFHEPAALPTGADRLLAADRQYQIAAALFYGGKYKEAEEAFRAIASDARSPWHGSAQYLIARTLIRQGTVRGDRAALARAEAALALILKDPGQGRWHNSAQGLLDLVRGQLSPEDRLVELGVALSKPGLGSAIGQAMTDYTTLWYRHEKGPAARSELADWITTFQAGDKRHALDRWRSGGGAPWFVAALSWAAPTDSDAADLVSEARKIRPDSPEYATAAYHGVRISARIVQSKDQTRVWADEALAAKLPLSARNALLAERMALTRNWTEFLRYAPRRPVAVTYSIEIEDLPGHPTFDWDAAETFNRKLPLDLWVDASKNRLLPRALQAKVAQAGWVRAVILNRAAEARALASRLAGDRPQLAQRLREYQQEKSADAAKFDAVLLMLRAPGLSPLVRQGFGRYTRNPVRRDEFRDNWWSLSVPADGLVSGDSSRVRLEQAGGTAVSADFLSPPQRSLGEKEWNALNAVAAVAPNFLCAETLAWAKSHSSDPRVPEALYLAVNATHYGPRDAGTTAWSKKAFQLLHSRYPKSPWAQSARYWY